MDGIRILKLTDMKHLYKLIFICLAACALSAGCGKEEDPVDPYSRNWVYLEQPSNNSFHVSFKSEGIWTNGFNEADILKRVRCTKPAKSDLTVTLAIDGALVDEYNLRNNTRYQLLPVAKLEKESFTIRQGEYVSSDSIRIVYPEADKLFEGGSAEYILPVTVGSAPDELSISEQAVIYLFYTAEEIAGQVKTNPAGTAADRTGWTIKDEQGVEYTNKLATTATASVDFSEGDMIVVNFPEAVNLKSMGLIYTYDYYSAKNVTAYVSADGVEYKSVGTYDLPRKDKHNIELYKAQSVKSFKLRFNTSQGSRITVSEVVATIE